MRAMKSFIDEGDKVKVTLRFRGREMAHQDIGRPRAGTHPHRPRGRDQGGANAPHGKMRQMVMVLVPNNRFAEVSSPNPGAHPHWHGIKEQKFFVSFFQEEILPYSSHPRNVATLSTSSIRSMSAYRSSRTFARRTARIASWPQARRNQRRE